MARTVRTTYVVLDWREDGQYHIANAYGAKVYSRLPAAEKYAATINAAGRNAVVRSLQYVRTFHATIDANGKIALLKDCPCLTGGRGYLPECIYHGQWPAVLS